MLSRRLKPLLALAFVAWPLALATSAQAEAPGGSDFTQELPEVLRVNADAARVSPDEHDHAHHGPVLFRTPAITAPRRFDLVGVAGEVHALEYRTQRRGDGWTDWVEAENGDPVYAGGADRVQVRSRDARIHGELHYIRIDDGSVPADRLAERGAGADALARPRPGVKQLPAQPSYVTRAEWGANAPRTGCIPREAPVTGRVKAGVIHHTVSTNTYTELEAPGLVLAICRYHRNANGWNDIGYNALVDRFGNLYEGRAGGMQRAVIGAQAEGINSYTTGIASIGDNRVYPASPIERKAFVNYFAWKFSIAGITNANGRATLLSSGGSTQRTPSGDRVRVPRIFSHNFTNFTACAGEALIREIPKIRRAVQRKLGGVAPEPPPAGVGRR